MKLDNINISARLLKIPICITGIIYSLIALSMLVRIANGTNANSILTLLPIVIILPLLAFAHFKAFQALKATDKIQMHSSEWSSLPNIASGIFLAAFFTVLFFIVTNIAAFLVFIVGMLLYILLIFVTFGNIFTSDWFSFKYFTHYPLDFWRWEHKGIAYLFPHEHDHTKAIFIIIAVVVFVIPTLAALLILLLKHSSSSSEPVVLKTETES